MKLVGQSFEIITPRDSLKDRYAVYTSIVDTARKSFNGDIPGPDSSLEEKGAFIRKRLEAGHFSVVEFATMKVTFTTNRAVANELTRHREMSWLQESTRYCNYSKGKFGSEVSFIYSPYFSVGTAGFDSFVQSCEKAEKEYFALLNIGYTPQQARDVLPLATKTTLDGFANLREWRHIFSLRADETTGPVHPMMKQLMVPLLKEAKKRLPDIFFDLGNDETTGPEDS